MHERESATGAGQHAPHAADAGATAARDAASALPAALTAADAAELLAEHPDDRDALLAQMHVRPDLGNAFVADVLAAEATLDEPMRARAGNRKKKKKSQPKAPTRDDALKAHKANVDLVEKVLRDGAALVPDARKGAADRNGVIRNTCQWILAGNCDAVVLTPTHDAWTRKPGAVAYFDRTALRPSRDGDYDETNVDDPRIMYAPSSFKGGLSRNLLQIMDPGAMTPDYLIDVLVHEVQHDADQSNRGDPWRVAGNPNKTSSEGLKSETAFNLFQTEFRAYWVGAAEGTPTNTYGSAQQPATNAKPLTFTDPDTKKTTTVQTGFHNERQEKIFWHLVDYEYSWVAELYALDPVYKDMVDRTIYPRGGNLINSVRIQHLSEALVACTPQLDETAAPVEAMFEKARQLDGMDRDSLTDRSTAGPFWSQARRSLSTRVYNRLVDLLAVRALGDFPAPSTDPDAERDA